MREITLNFPLYYGIEDGSSIAEFSNGSFLIVPRGISVGKFGVNPSNTNDKWILLAGNNFGLTQSGKLYASSGNFNGLSIDRIKIGNSDYGS
jgi:hypothetical protein